MLVSAVAKHKIRAAYSEMPDMSEEERVTCVEETFKRLERLDLPSSLRSFRYPLRCPLPIRIIEVIDSFEADLLNLQPIKILDFEIVQGCIW